MDYLKAGQYINFGLSRGLGSVSYAAGAVLVGQLIDIINPTAVSYTHLDVYRDRNKPVKSPVQIGPAKNDGKFHGAANG